MSEDRISWKTMLVGFIDEKQDKLAALKEQEQTPKIKEQIESLTDTIKQHYIDHSMELNREDYAGRVQRVQSQKNRWAREVALASKNEKTLG